MTTTAAPHVALAPARAGRTYIAGPMTGLPDFNYPAFNAAAAALRAQGVDAINPAEHGIVPGATWEDYLRADLVQLATCEAVYFLPGWSKSRGALLEHHVATALGMRLEYAGGAERAAPAQPVERRQLERIRNELHAMSKQVPDDWADPIIELQRDVQSLIDGSKAVGNG